MWHTRSKYATKQWQLGGVYVYIQIANEHKISVEKLEATMGQVIAYLYVHRHKTIGNRILWEIILSENPEVIREILERRINIRAENREMAEDIAKGEYRAEKIVLDSDDFCGMDIEVHEKQQVREGRR